MRWQPGPVGGSGDGPGHAARPPGGVPPARDSRLPQFASDQGGDVPVASARLALLAEELILGQLSGKLYPQVLRLAEQAALTVDPELATRRREQAQRKDARVTFFRELAGTAALSGRDLPPDAALAAMASVNARAQEYGESGAFGATRTDVLSAYAYLDLLNGVTVAARIASAEAQDEDAEAAEALAWARARADRANEGAGGGVAGGSARTAPTADGDREAGAGDRDQARHLGRDGFGGDDGERGYGAGSGGAEPEGADYDVGAGPGEGAGPGDGGDAGEGGEGSPCPGGPGAVPVVPSMVPGLRLRPPDLIVPLATLLGLAERPGEIQGFGLLDAALARDLMNRISRREQQQDTRNQPLPQAA